MLSRTGNKRQFMSPAAASTKNFLTLLVTVSCPLFYLEIKPFMTFKVAIFPRKQHRAGNTSRAALTINQRT